MTICIALRAACPRALFALAATTLLTLALATTAPANTYTFHSCDRASGGLGTSAGWTTNGSAHNRTVDINCETNGSVRIRLLGDGPYAPGLDAQAVWTAPANTKISSANFRRHYNYFGENGWGAYSGAIGWYVDVRDGDRTKLLEHCHVVPSEGCPPAAVAIQDFRGLHHDRIVATINCWGGVPSPGCGKPHPALAAPEFTFDWLKVTLTDDRAPVVGRVVGAMTSGASHRGAEALEADVSDLGGGVYRTRLFVDGALVSERSVDPASKTCRDANAENSELYEFDAPVPCPLSAVATASVDTRQFSEGRHRLSVVVEDAAGNERQVFANDSFIVDNVVEAAAVEAPGVAGVAQIGRTLTAHAGRWTGALGEPSWQWLRCDSLGTGCAPVDGAVRDEYVVSAADVGKRLRVRVGRVNAARESSSADSAPTELIEAEAVAASQGAPGRPGESGPAGASGASQAGPAGATGAAGSAGAAGGPNGTPAAKDARVTLAFASGGATSTTKWGRGATVAGRVTDANGRAIRGAAVTITETPALPGAVPAVTATATTNADGRFTHRVARTASSRTIRAAYAAERGGPAVAEAQVRLEVSAALKLAVTLKGVIVTYRGTVLSGPLPSGGKLVIIQGRAKGGSWQTFATRRATRGGRFSGRYRLRARTPGRVLQFRARVVAESGYAYRPVTSKAISRTVR